MNTPLLNCDIGESFGAWTTGRDADIMPFIDCANIACGFHASDPGTMRKTVALALPTTSALAPIRPTRTWSASVAAP
jgi:UPF0271 protein